MLRILIQGMGVVGTATKKLLEEGDHLIECYDPNIERYKSKPQGKFDVSFICVNVVNEKGIQDLDILMDCLDLSKNIADKIFIRSTVLPGITSYLSSLYGKKLYHMPEYLREKDGYNSIKGMPIITSYMEPFFLSKLFPERQCYSYNSEICELSKYIQNCFFAMKINFFNLIFDYCKTHEYSYSNAIDCVMKTASVTGTISPECMKVPGPDSKMGYGGKCLPKDIEAFATHTENRSKAISEFLKIIIKDNTIFRGTK